MFYKFTYTRFVSLNTIVIIKSIKIMKKIIFFIGILTVLSFAKVEVFNKNMSVIIVPESKLQIRGNSNINKFKCDFNVLEIKNPIPLFYEQKENKIYFKKATLALRNSCFDCGSRGINKDFHKLLKSNKFPQIFLNLKEIEKKDNIIEASVEMIIAGISKTYKLPVEIEGDDSLLVSGVLNLNISDFNLKAPKKLLGLIVVSENIEIDFNLVIKEI